MIFWAVGVQAALRKELKEAVEQCETRSKEQLVGCIVRCEAITRDVEALRAEEADEEDAVAESEAAAANVAGLERQLETVQRKHNHVEKTTRRDLGVLGERLDAVVEQCSEASEGLVEVRVALENTRKVARSAERAGASGGVGRLPTVPAAAIASPAASRSRAQNAPAGAGGDSGASVVRGGGQQRRERSPGRTSSRYTSGGARNELGLPPSSMMPPPLPGR